ncbi:MAG: hypothetical protein KIS73_06275 [Enhydrobacter sp.]|nr:hypothetical protein [Enhydrobacter sp.]
MAGEKIWYYYKMIAPVRECYRDDGTRTLFQIPVLHESGAEMEVALIGEPSAPESIRIRLENPTHNFTNDQWEAINHLAGYMLTTLRLVHDYSADFARYSGHEIAAWTQADKEGRPTLNIDVKVMAGPPRHIPIDEVRNTFAHTFDNRALFNALADSQRTVLPIQYRYLCLFKVLEHEFKIAGKWGDRLRLFLQPHDAEFQQLDCGPGTLLRAVNDLRDKAAHIKTGKRSDVVGITWRDAGRIEKVMPLLHRIVLNHIEERYGLTRRSPPGA